MLKTFDADFSTWKFNSDLGKGEIDVDKNGKVTLTFFDIKSHIDDQLVLTHLGEYHSIDH